MQLDLRNGGTWIAALLLLPTVLLAMPPALQSTRTSGAGSKTEAGPTLICADSVADQDGPGCLQASSVPAPGVLFPPPHDGGTNNVTSGSDSYIGGGRDNTAGTNSTVAGGVGNTAPLSATIAGGFQNTAGYGGTIAGGSNNETAGNSCVIGGGFGNYAAGTAATISGGNTNDCRADRGTISGGNNQYIAASAIGGTIGGGRLNNVSGSWATVPGGESNSAAADNSLAAGRSAHAGHKGAFVWGDSAFNINKTSSADDQFNVYASGGTRIFSNTSFTTGVLLAAGGGSWTSVSDREAKENFEAVDGREVLERLAAIPISTWNYKEQDDDVRHMGPMAQDFHAAFGLGLGDRTIDTIDPDGVALAAIQGLNAKLAERDAELARLRADLDTLREALAALSAAE